MIAALKAELTAVNAAILAILSGAQTYTLDTGQTRQTVTKANLATLRLHRRELMDEIQSLQDLITGQPSYVGRPGWG